MSKSFHVFQTKFFIQSHVLDSPETVVDAALRKWHNHSVRNYDYMLKVFGQEHYLYGKSPLHQFKVGWMDLSGDKNISILHLSCRTSDLQFSLVRQTHALVL